MQSNHIKYLKKYFYYKSGGNKNKMKKYSNKLKRSENFYKFNVKEPWFSFIKTGEKKVEGRLNTGIFSKLRIGDIIEWKNGSNTFRVTISKINKYDSFKEMIQTEDIKNVLPQVETTEKGVAVYRQYYDEQREISFGVVAIHMMLL